MIFLSPLFNLGLNLFSGTEQLTPNAWSLTYEVIFYALACLTVFFLLKYRNWLGSAVMIGLSLLFLFFFPITAYFVFGIVIRLLFDRGIQLPHQVARPLEMIAFACCIIFGSAKWFAYTQADLSEPLVPAIMLSTACYFYFAISPSSLTSKLLDNRMAAYLGTVSYSFYFVHPYSYLLTRLLFERLGFFTENWLASMALFFLVTTPITLVTTHIVHNLLERWPYQWFSHQRIYRTKATHSHGSRVALAR